jgi:hypothetical protein
MARRGDRRAGEHPGPGDRRDGGRGGRGGRSRPRACEGRVPRHGREGELRPDVPIVQAAHGRNTGVVERRRWCWRRPREVRGVAPRLHRGSVRPLAVAARPAQLGFDGVFSPDHFFRRSAIRRPARIGPPGGGHDARRRVGASHPALHVGGTLVRSGSALRAAGAPGESQGRGYWIRSRGTHGHPGARDGRRRPNARARHVSEFPYPGASARVRVPGGDRGGRCARFVRWRRVAGRSRTCRRSPAPLLPAGARSCGSADDRMPSWRSRVARRRTRGPDRWRTTWRDSPPRPHGPQRARGRPGPCPSIVGGDRAPSARTDADLEAV